MNRRQASKTETRRLILSAAKRLYLEKGVNRCTIRDIASKAGVSPASVMVHFNNKTALVESVLYEEIEVTLTQALATLPSDAGLLEGFMHLSRTLYTFYDTKRDLYRILVGTFVSNAAVGAEPQNPHLLRQMDQYLTLLAEMVEDEKRAGRIRPETDAFISASALAAMYFGALTQFFRLPEMTVSAALDLLEAMARQLLSGISVPSENQ